MFNARAKGVNVFPLQGILKHVKNNAIGPVAYAMSILKLI
jgi:hypothetical protein